jgi:hypothetical protein
MSGTGDHDSRMLELAARIGDGEPIDWETTERTLPDYRDKIARLRAVETIGRLHGAALDAELAERTLTDEWGSSRSSCCRRSATIRPAARRSSERRGAWRRCVTGTW